MLRDSEAIAELRRKEQENFSQGYFINDSGDIIVTREEKVGSCWRSSSDGHG